MTSQNEVVFLFDVDNTLLDNDRVENDLRHHIEREFGVESRDRYFAAILLQALLLIYFPRLP